MNNNLRGWGVAMASCLSLLASAQTAKTETPKLAPQLTYRSAFADYKPYRDAPLANWREVNDTVARASGGASGQAGHSMGMMGMEAAGRAPAPAAAANSPMPMKPEATVPIHGSQHKHGGKP